MTFWQRADPIEASHPIITNRPSNSAMLVELAILMLRLIEAATIIGIGYVLVQTRGPEIPASMAADHYRLAALAAVIYSALAAAIGAYDTDVLFSTRRVGILLLRSWGVTGVFLVTLGFVLRASADISRGWALVWFFSTAIAIVVIRALFSAWMRKQREAGAFNLRTAIFGGGPQAVRLLSYLKSNRELAIKIIGRFDDRSATRLDDDSLPASQGELPTLLQQIRAGEVDQVIVALPWASDRRIREVVQQLALTPARIRLAPDLVGYTYREKPMVLLGTLPVITVFDRPISGLDQSVKWLEDQLLGWTLVILLSPLLLAIAFAIKLDSTGPVFFRQSRDGFNDQQFRVWKFRSMRTETCQEDAIDQARADDGRVTRVGGFLRRWSLDELPQLFNVVAGEMSLVGPRPHAPSTRAGQKLFREAVATYASRHRVKPGITGWAQVCGWRGPTDTEEKLARRLEHDLYYIENWSLWFDLWILARTALAIVVPKNAF